jgi:5-(carboxyamino)imidazole ribonucleotide synthase
MEKLVTSDLKLGIIAGGQLGKMLIQDASRWDVRTHVLDGDPTCPAGGIAGLHVLGSPDDEEVVYQFGRGVDVLTFEIERVHVGALKRLRDDGVRVRPAPELLERLQDKALQKALFFRLGIPSAPFGLHDDAGAIRAAVSQGGLALPFVQKLRRGGFDGRGVAVIRDDAALDRLLDGPSITEELVDVAREIAVIVARGARGELRTFPVVEMVFDPDANLVRHLVCPSSVDPPIAVQACEAAACLAEALELTGLLAVEFFVTGDGSLLVNEVAPRPHNSGHHTIDSVMTSQFEQHLRAILDLPLGSTALRTPAVMINLLGSPGHVGPVRYEGLTESMRLEGVKIHLYGKKLTRPFRKMGHVTVLAATPGEALEKAEKVRAWIHVKT